MRGRKPLFRTKAHGNFRHDTTFDVHPDHTIMDKTYVALAVEGPVNTYFYLSPAQARTLGQALLAGADETEAAR